MAVLPRRTVPAETLSAPVAPPQAAPQPVAPPAPAERPEWIDETPDASASYELSMFYGDSNQQAVIITREEIRGLMANRLFVPAPPLGVTKLTEWIDRHKATLGRHYTSELARRVDRTSAYGSN